LALECLDKVGFRVISLADGKTFGEGGIGGGAGQNRDLELWVIDEGICNEFPDIAAGLYF
jgi:hypothetical protein